MKKEKVLILMEVLNPNDDIFFDDWIKNGYKASVIFKKVSKPIRALRRFFLMNNIGDISMWLGNWTDDLDKYDSIIIHMNRLTRYLPEYILKKNKNIKVIGWYWNTITKQSEPIKSYNPNIMYFSFDKNDCIKYCMKQNIQYYCPIKKENKNKEYDIYFIGRAKGREKQIKEFWQKAEKMELKCNINVIDDNSLLIKPYKEVREELVKTKAVLEINKENQIGFTLRTLESLFYEIKLITNNKEVKKLPIYNKNNVFIIGEDSYEKLNEFINSKYDTSVNKYKNDYSLDTWFNNFYN